MLPLSRTQFLISLFTVLTFWFIFRLRASPQSRPKFGLLFIVAGQIVNIVLRGLINVNIPTPLGLMNAFLTWLFLTLGALESALYLRQVKPMRDEKASVILVFLLLFNISNLISLIFSKSTILYSDFYQFLSILIVMALAPTLKDLGPTLHFLTGLVAFNIYCVFAHIVSPDFFFNSHTEYSLPPYKNITWDWVGITTRYRGPFQHPNAAGGYFALVMVLLVLSKRKYFYLWIAPTSLLLALTASRTSQIVVLLLFFISSTQSLFGKGGSLNKWKYFYYVLISFSFYYYAFRIDWTATGRTALWVRAFNRWLDSPFYGYGRIDKPAPGSGLGLVENSFISTLLISGILGGLCFGAIIFLIIKLKKGVIPTYQKLINGYIAGFLFAITLEPAFLGGYDIGALYIIFFYCLINNKGALKFKLIPDHVYRKIT